MGYFSELQINMDDDKLMPVESLPKEFKILGIRICDDDYNLTPIQRGLVLYRAQCILQDYNKLHSKSKRIHEVKVLYQRIVDNLCNEYEVS